MRLPFHKYKFAALEISLLHFNGLEIYHLT
jgi:hypothetical protein